MKTAKLLFGSVLLALLFAFGCGSSNDGGSSGSGSTSGAGAVVTAFMQNGTFQVVDVTNDATYGPFTFKGSDFNFNIASNVPRPFVVEVTDAFMCDSTQLERKLSKVVKPGDDITKIYITIFSTLEADAYTQAMELGQDALATGEAAKLAAFNSLGLNMNATKVLQKDPRTSPDLEFAQQAFFAAVGLSDGTGLKAQDSLNDPLRKILKGVGEIGADYNVSELINDVGVVPSAELAKPAVRAEVKASVEKTFEDGKAAGQTEIDKADAGQAADDVQTKDVAATPGSLIVEDVSLAYYGNATTNYPALGPKKLVMTAIDNSTKLTGDEHRFIADGGGILLAYEADGTAAADITSWSAGWGENEAKAIDASKRLYAKVPDGGLEAGTYHVTFASLEEPSVKFTVAGVIMDPTQDVIIPDMMAYTAAAKPGGGKDDQYGYLSFVNEDSPVTTYIPKGAQADFSLGGTGAPSTADKPELVMMFAYKGNDNMDKSFNVRITAPEGIVFVEENDGETVLSPFYTFVIERVKVEGQDKGEWTVGEDSADILHLESSMGVVSKFCLKADLRLQVVSDRVELGEHIFNFRVEDAETGKVTTRYQMPLWTLNKKSAARIAKITTVQYDYLVEPTIDMNPIGKIELKKNMTCHLKSWEDLAGVFTYDKAPYDIPDNPGSVFPYSKLPSGHDKPVFQRVKNDGSGTSQQNALALTYYTEGTGEVAGGELAGAVKWGPEDGVTTYLLLEGPEYTEKLGIRIYYLNADGPGTEHVTIQSDEKEAAPMKGAAVG